ncbi:unnamed protein product [Rotaria sordida]|uniref:G-protein coupled receptors family 1 profile domain-containing protein n=2 Tax=Rotaria sordida TaxID=392033 RepID=A0A815S189_9BILA|nr:unnamed protein product [Rotaria sordida]
MEYMDSFISNPVRFWLFLTALIPSVGCSIAILYYMLSSQTRRRAINNHVIIVLLFNNLIYELIDISLFLNYYRLDTVSPATQSLCLMWIFIDETLYTVSTIVVAWASIERHILIFHSQWLSSSRRRFLIHYAPLALLVSYIILFHFVIIIFPPCENTYDYTQEICGHPLCFHDSKLIGTWDSIAHNIIPTLTIVIFSITLLVRVLLQNRRMHQVVQWRKHRKMAIQLLSISMLYLFLYIPIMCIDLAELCCISHELGGHFEQYARFLSYYVIFLLPFVCLVSLMESVWQLKNIFPCWYRLTPIIHPTIHFIPRQPNAIEINT